MCLWHKHCNGVYIPVLILNLSARGKWVVSVMLWSLYPWGRPHYPYQSLVYKNISKFAIAVFMSHSCPHIKRNNFCKLTAKCLFICACFFDFRISYCSNYFQNFVLGSWLATKDRTINSDIYNVLWNLCIFHHAVLCFYFPWD